ncbi:MAG: hypothetical protein ACQRW7_00730 [Caulobacterales bacterium]|uniref:hypothetical protein n=1 Tax=Glycocaulis sp. TaxID=1969725 RepID=UPI003F9F4397
MNTLRHAISGLALALGVSACVSATPAGLPGEPEPVYGSYRAADGSLRVQVASNGCTREESFEPVVMMDSRTRWSFTVEFRRLQPDLCRAYLPEGVELSWTLDDLGLPPSAAVRVINREVPAPRPRR